MLNVDTSEFKQIQIIFTLDSAFLETSWYPEILLVDWHKATGMESACIHKWCLIWLW